MFSYGGGLVHDADGRPTLAAAEALAVLVAALVSGLGASSFALPERAASAAVPVSKTLREQIAVMSTGVDQSLGEPPPLLVTALDPHDPVRGGQLRHLPHPGEQAGVGGGGVVETGGGH